MGMLTYADPFPPVYDGSSIAEKTYPYKLPAHHSAVTGYCTAGTGYCRAIITGRKTGICYRTSIPDLQWATPAYLRAITAYQ